MEILARHALAQRRLHAERFNALHERAGHAFQGRYKAIPVERDSYLVHRQQLDTQG